MKILLGFLLGALISGIARRLEALTRRGVWAAALVGGITFGLGGFSWSVVLLTFFVSSSLLSHLPQHQQPAPRDWDQVLASGGVAALLVIVDAIHPDTAWAWVAFGGAMAAVTADTWATELGTLSKKKPRLITTGEVVGRGKSGGISLLGVFASVGGASLIGAVTGAFPVVTNPLTLTIILTSAGLVGSLFDSFLGATIQAIYHCPACQKETEAHPRHTCRTPTIPLQGLPWLNNEWVNFLASLAGSGLALLLMTIVSS